MYVLTTEKQAIKKIPEKTYSKSAKILTESSSLNEIHNNIILTESDKNVLIFTNLGNVYRLGVDKIIEARFKDRGTFLKDLIVGFNPDEKVVKIFEENDKFFKQNLICFTKNGLVKLTSAQEFNISKNITTSMKLKDDEILNIEIFDKNKNLMFVSKLGMALYAKNEDIPLTSKSSGAVKGMNLNEGDECLFACQIFDEKLLCVTNKGYSKKIELSNFELLSKNRKGVKVYGLGKNENTGTQLVFACILKQDCDLFVTDNKNKNYIVDSSNAQISNRTNKGNIILKDRKLVELKSVFKIVIE
ncbi:MAG: DNA gyrase C-terminal beta-propeller domain-containing protein [Christensenellales bacterium]